MTNHFLGLVPPSTSRLSPLETQRRRSQQSRGRSLQQRAKETQAPARGPRPDGGPAHVRPRDPRRCSGSSERPPREAPTTLSGRPAGTAPPAPPAPPPRGPAPRGGGEKGGRAAGAHRTRGSGSQSVSPKKGARGCPRRLGHEWNPEAILGGEEATAPAPEAAPRARTPATLPATASPR